MEDSFSNSLSVALGEGCVYKEETRRRVNLLGGEEVVLVVEAGDDEGIVIQDLAIIRIDDHDDEMNNSF